MNKRHHLLHWTKLKFAMYVLDHGWLRFDKQRLDLQCSKREPYHWPQPRYHKLERCHLHSMNHIPNFDQSFLDEHPNQRHYAEEFGH